MQHLDEGTIHTWLDGELSAAEAALAERHIAECAECTAAVAEARGMIAGATRIVSALDVGHGAVAALPRQPAKPAAAGSVWRSLRFTPTRAALAASLLVAAGALLTIRHDTSEKLTFPTPASAVSAAASAPAPVSAQVAPSNEAPRLAANAQPAMDSAAPRATSKRTVLSAPESRAAESKVADANAGQTRVADSIGRAVRPTATGGVTASVAVQRAAPAAAPSVPPVSPQTPVAAPPGAVVAADAREPQRALIDSLAARGRAAGAGPERRLQSTMQLQEVVTTGAATGLDIAGCYQIKSDSAARSALLPNRFALERAPGAAASNIVWAVTPDGRMDTVVRGSNWVQLANDKARIQSIVGTKQQVVSLQLTSLGGVSAQALTAGQPRVFVVDRAACHR